MSLDAELGADLSSGLASLTAMADATTADPLWPAKLEAMEHALVAVQGGAVWSNMAVTDDDLAKLRSVRAVVDDWLATGKRPAGVALAAELRRSLFG